MRVSFNTEDEYRRQIAMLETAGFKVVSGPNLVWWADLQPDLHPPPLVDWWRMLDITNPRTKIYAARDGIKIYQSIDVVDPKPPPFATATQREYKKGDDFEVWDRVLPGSEWICIYRGLFVLWVSGHDTAAEKPG